MYLKIIIIQSLHFKAPESLTANFVAVMREMASGAIPSICSLTRADMATSGTPAADHTHTHTPEEMRTLVIHT